MCKYCESYGQKERRLTVLEDTYSTFPNFEIGSELESDAIAILEEISDLKQELSELLVEINEMHG